MTLQQLHQVITIAESRSMNEASRKLFVSQPNLSAVVRELEEEAGITIFIRSNRGIVLTPEGEEFIGYAKQVVEQYHLLESRYISSASKKKFSVSMQHYTFAVKAFVEVVKAVGMEEYEFAVHETQTNQVIENVRNMKSELGILFLSKFNEAVLQKLFKENDVIFEELFTCDTYVYLWKGHPLAQRDVISMKELQEYPCLVFEQGKNNSFYFAEEMKSTYEYKKMIHADDRATMLNLMVGLNGYTLCSGIICEELNGNDYAAVPLAESEKMRIGYIRHNMKSELGILFLSKFNEAVLQKLFKENDVIFEELFTCDTYVYLWKGHPLAQRDVISMKELQEYPCLVFEQGKNNSFYFAEEMKSTYEYKKMIHADDRATMLNLMVGLNGYTLCSGIICEELNGNDYAAVPLAESEKMRIGYIRHKGIKVSPIGELYVDILKKSGKPL